MIETNGTITFEVSDTIQVIRGPDTGTFGIVMSISGDELTCWGRCPSSIGAQSYNMRIPKADAMYIGRGKIRPLLPGESHKPVSVALGEEAAAAAPPRSNVATISKRARRNFAPPSIPPNPVPPPSPAAAPQPAPPAESVPMKQEPAPVQSIHGVQFGGANSEEVASKPKPPVPSEQNIDQKLLQPAVFRRASALDIHKTHAPTDEAGALTTPKNEPRQPTRPVRRGAQGQA